MQRVTYADISSSKLLLLNEHLGSFKREFLLKRFVLKIFYLNLLY